MIGPVVTVYNRAPFRLVVTKDGREHVLEPGINHITQDLVLYAKQQHPVPGSEDAGTLEYESFVSFVQPDPTKQRDPLDDYDADIIKLLPKERVNRMTLPPARQNVVETANVHPKGRRVGIEAPSIGMEDPGKFDG